MVLNSSQYYETYNPLISLAPPGLVPRLELTN